MDGINYLIDTYNFPLLTAFLIGVLTSISPCPLATNITAIAFISRNVKSPKHTLLNGFMYTIGRGISYTMIATLIYFGFSTFEISRLFQGWPEKLMGPILIIIGLVMLDVIPIHIEKRYKNIEKIKSKLAERGYFGSLLLGAVFALAFCPYSGVLFFGMLIPLVLSSSSALLLPPLFALGTGLPVIVFSLIIAYGIKYLSRALSIASKIDKIMRVAVGGIFIITGLYYTRYLIDLFF